MAKKSIDQSVDWRNGATTTEDYKVTARPVDTFVRAPSAERGMQVARALEQASGSVDKIKEVFVEYKQNELEKEAFDLDNKMQIAENNFKIDKETNPEKYKNADFTEVAGFRQEFYSDVNEFVPTLQAPLQRSFAQLEQTNNTALNFEWQEQNLKNQKEESWNDVITSYNTSADKSLARLDQGINSYAERWNMDRGDVNRATMASATLQLSQNDPSMYNALVQMKSEKGIDVFKVQKNEKEAAALSNAYNAYLNRMKAGQEKENLEGLTQALRNSEVGVPELLTAGVDWDKNKTAIKKRMMVLDAEELAEAAPEDYQEVQRKQMLVWAQTGIENPLYKIELNNFAKMLASGATELNGEAASKASNLYANLQEVSPTYVEKHIDSESRSKMDAFNMLTATYNFTPDQAAAQIANPQISAKVDPKYTGKYEDVLDINIFGEPSDASLTIPVANAMRDTQQLMSMGVTEDDAFDMVKARLKRDFQVINDAAVDISGFRNAFARRPDLIGTGVTTNEYIEGFLGDVEEAFGIEGVSLRRNTGVNSDTYSLVNKEGLVLNSTLGDTSVNTDDIIAFMVEYNTKIARGK